MSGPYSSIAAAAQLAAGEPRAVPPTWAYLRIATHRCWNSE